MNRRALRLLLRLPRRWPISIRARCADVAAVFIIHGVALLHCSFLRDHFIENFGNLIGATTRRRVPAAAHLHGRGPRPCNGCGVRLDLGLLGITGITGNGDFECPPKVRLIALRSHVAHDVDHVVLDALITRHRMLLDKTLDFGHGLLFNSGVGNRWRRLIGHRLGMNAVIVDQMPDYFAFSLLIASIQAYCGINQGIQAVYY